ncbi:hypothetical protein QOZ80_9AG0673730 [Eleusine coracana subsp. coracana]|nr:hypothetical protein QOZ80_9AG0673730 [Eleusine coracana subsp. coracana]
MAGESCHSRSLSWLARSCIPADPARHTAVPVPVPISAASTTNLISSTHPASEEEEESPISALPDDLLLECLARVPRASLLPLPAVCRRFASLLASDAFLHLRRARGLLRPTLLAVSVPSSSHGSTFARALIHLDAPRPDLAEVAALPLPQTLLHLHCHGAASSSAFAHARAVAVGRSVFLIGRGATLRVDALTGATRSCAPTLFPRKKFAAAATRDRIYVAGGSSRTAAVEEYDPAVDAWRVVAQAPRRRYGCAGAVAGGVFYVAGGVAVSASGIEARAACAAGTVDALHLASGAWARGAPRAVPGGGCVVGACGAGDHLYVVASHAAGLSFWRLGVSGRGGGAWVPLEAPPVPRGCVVGLGVAVRVAMAGVGAGDRIVAVVNASAVRRGHGGAGVPLQGLVLVYDVAGGKWTRAPDLPPGFRRAACVAVDDMAFYYSGCHLLRRGGLHGPGLRHRGGGGPARSSSSPPSRSPPTSASSPRPAPRSEPVAVVVVGLDGAAIDALYPKYPHVVVGSGGGDDDPCCAICLGELAAGAGPGAATGSTRDAPSGGCV